MTLKFGVPET